MAAASSSAILSCEKHLYGLAVRTKPLARYLHGSAPRRRAPRAGNVRKQWGWSVAAALRRQVAKSTGRYLPPIPQAKTSARQIAPAWCLRPCTPHPSRRHRACREYDNGKLFRSLLKVPDQRPSLKRAAGKRPVSRRTDDAETQLGRVPIHGDDILGASVSHQQGGIVRGETCPRSKKPGRLVEILQADDFLDFTRADAHPVNCRLPFGRRSQENYGLTVMQPFRPRLLRQGREFAPLLACEIEEHKILIVGPLAYHVPAVGRLARAEKSIRAGQFPCFSCCQVDLINCDGICFAALRQIIENERIPVGRPSGVSKIEGACRHHFRSAAIGRDNINLPWLVGKLPHKGDLPAIRRPARQESRHRLGCKLEPLAAIGLAAPQGPFRIRDVRHPLVVARKAYSSHRNAREERLKLAGPGVVAIEFSSGKTGHSKQFLPVFAWQGVRVCNGSRCELHRLAADLAQETSALAHGPDLALRLKDEILPIRRPLAATLVCAGMPPLKDLMKLRAISRNLPQRSSLCPGIKNRKANLASVRRPCWCIRRV